LKRGSNTQKKKNNNNNKLNEVMHALGGVHKEGWSNMYRWMEQHPKKRIMPRRNEFHQGRRRIIEKEKQPSKKE
jgi:superfamily I DNA and RNA helicase